MKKLLALLSVATIGSTVPTTTVYSLSSDKSHTTDKVAAYSSEAVASSLIQKSESGYNSSSFLNAEMFLDPNQNNTHFDPNADPTKLAIASGLNHTFGTHSSQDLNSLVDASSDIKDNDQTTPGKDAAPSSIQGILSILQMVQNSNNTLKDPSTIFALIQDLNIPAIIGKSLSSLIGQNQIVDALNNIPLSVFATEFNHYADSFNKDDVYASFTQNPDKANGTLYTGDNSVFGEVTGGLLGALLDLSGGKALTNTDYKGIADFVLVLLNYISQFNFLSTNISDYDHLYDTKQTNEQVRTNIDKTTFSKTINYSNLGNLLQNIVDFDKNGGLGIAQVVDLMFGSENSLITSNDYNIPNLLDLQLTPDERYYNPVMTILQMVLPLSLSSFIKDPNLVNLINQYDLAPQLISLLGGFLDAVVTNRTIDNAANVLKFAEQNIDQILKDFGINPDSLSKQLGQLLTDLNNFFTKLEPRYAYGWMSMDDTYDPSVDPNMKMMPYEDSGSTWTDLWNHNQNTDTVWGSTSKVLTDIFTLIGMKVTLPTQFNGFQSLIDGLLSAQVPGLSLTYEQLIQYLDDKNGLIQTLTKNFAQIEKMFQDMLTALTDPTMLKNAESWIDTNIDASNDKQIQALIDRYKNPDPSDPKKEFNLIQVIEIFSLASAKNEFKNKATATSATTELMTLLGYTTDASKINPATVYDVLTNNWHLLSEIVTAAVTSFSDIRNSFYGKINDIMAKYKVEANSIAEDQKTGNITYKLDDNNATKPIVYNVTLLMQDNGFYTIAIKSATT